jgi:hypothetical protein
LVRPRPLACSPTTRSICQHVQDAIDDLAPLGLARAPTLVVLDFTAGTRFAMQPQSSSLRSLRYVDLVVIDVDRERRGVQQLGG